MTRMTGLTFVASFGIAFAGLAGAQDGGAERAGSTGAKEAAGLPRCPMMDEPIDFTAMTMTDDGPVYFCCVDCIEQFKADPAKHAADVRAQREALAKRPRVQVACPLEGGPISEDAYTQVGGQKVYFCCENCKARYESDPAKYAGKLEASYTYQTRCPVSGDEIDPASSIELAGGQRVYFCCGRCGAKLLAEPDKYIERLQRQGYMYRAKDLKAKSPD